MDFALSSVGMRVLSVPLPPSLPDDDEDDELVAFTAAATALVFKIMVAGVLS